ncbi:MAG: bifunctional riboflavin kinase/FAD synthetase [Chloroflexi bacterium]|nr:bifunctional riboflavin kinase/FAD synthetase [Chloroflexota bacterium]
MQVDKELAEIAPQKDMLLTIGVFDGVHLGHKYLISKLVEQARQQGLLSGVVTFRQHPLGVLSPETKLVCLTGVAEKTELIKKEGVDVVVALSFTQELAQLSAREFVQLLKKHLRMKGLVVGPDFALGKGRKGTADALRRLGQEMGFSVTVVPPMKANGEVVSSTAIRNALAVGDMARVARMIGRPFSLRGRVVSGDSRGSTLGFPTANLEVEPRQALPADGVYATMAYIEGKAYPAVTNIGWRPTFGGKERTIETFILDYHGNLYGREFRIDIIERLRGEKRFAGPEDLKKQIAEDIRRGRDILASQSARQA